MLMLPSRRVMALYGQWQMGLRIYGVENALDKPVN
jgi:hypothetical protein